MESVRFKRACSNEEEEASMTAEEMFDLWWRSEYGPHMSKVSYLAAKSSWLASREATARRCLEISRNEWVTSSSLAKSKCAGAISDAIEREFSL